MVCARRRQAHPNYVLIISFDTHLFFQIPLRDCKSIKAVEGSCHVFNE